MRAISFIPTVTILSSLTLPCLGCPNKCSRNGTCTPLGICSCNSGFTGGDCSIRTCPSGLAFSDVAEASDMAHGSIPCSGKGTCVNGNCVCRAGFTGTACERTKCWRNCNNNGRCASMRHFAETTRNHESQQFTYNQWDADKIYGCICDSGYQGFDCSLRVCPSGDDPLTTTETAQEIQLLRCTANSFSGGKVVLYYDGNSSANIPVDASPVVLQRALEEIPDIETVRVTYSEGSVLCRNDGTDNIVSITFVSNFGPMPPLVAESIDMELSSVVEIAADDSYGMLTDHNGVNFFHTKGNKENDECSNRGICDQGTGTCKCFNTNGDTYAGSDGYGGSGNRGDCGHAVTAPISTCPGNPPCSNRGVCDPITLRCTCEESFTGGDCSLRTCKKGLAWFGYPSANNVAHDIEMECSNMGVCHRVVGECACNYGFFGAACEYMGCGSEGSATSCSGHGSCLSMRELGLLHEDASGSLLPVTYGSIANGAATWDADRIFGCSCDDNFEGFDCSRRTCPVGVDPDSGDTTLHTCSNHGLCDHNVGRCKCFAGWGSSDGGGILGPNNDCGARSKLRGIP